MLILLEQHLDHCTHFARSRFLSSISNHRSQHLPAHSFLCRRPPTHGAKCSGPPRMARARLSHPYFESWPLYPFTRVCVRTHALALRAKRRLNACQTRWVRIGPAAAKSRGVTNAEGKREKDEKGGNNGRNAAGEKERA